MELIELFLELIWHTVQQIDLYQPRDAAHQNEAKIGI